VAETLKQPDDPTFDAALAWVCAHSGFSPDGVDRQRLKAAVQRYGPVLPLPPVTLATSEQLLEAVMVCETYFFRQPEHVEHMLHRWLPGWLELGRPTLRAWSAGCASGEEAYSLAAGLMGALPFGVDFEVLGTDLLERNLLQARAGVYSRSSLRSNPPAAAVLFDDVSAEYLRIQERFLKRVRCARCNLLEPPPGEFDVVFCRNVLMYFSPPAAAIALRHLAASVAPGGLLVLGTLDVADVPAGLKRLGPPELSSFVRPPASASPKPERAPPSPAPRPSSPSAAPRSAASASADACVAEHLRALAHLDRGQPAAAETVLRALLARHPDYLPGLLERALLLEKLGHAAKAAEAMRAVLSLASALADGVTVQGPELLPVAYYRASASAFLQRDGEAGR
jgi:chemotaxis methyl-accepting protein methylase